MEYIFLAAGIILVIVGSTRILSQKNKDCNNPLAEAEPFENIFSDDLILQKLNSIEDRLQIIEDRIEKPSLSIEDSSDNAVQCPEDDDGSDINSQIAMMMGRGFTVDEISEKYGITKGEVLLRAGLKK